MKPTWIMNTNMGAESDIQQYVKAVKDSGANVIEVDYVPLSNELPDIQVNGPVVAYGSITFLDTIRNSGKWPLAIFDTPETFTYEEWAKNYGSLLLNSPEGVELTTVGDFCHDNRDPEEDIFVRPQHDTKSIVGSVEKAGKFKEWCQKASSDEYAGVNKDTPILIATPYGIEAEWRLFIIDHKIVSASQYKKKGRFYKQAGAPEDVLAFAQKAIEKWSPVSAYVLDICHSAGNCYIVEAQNFNGAGHYAADLGKVVAAVNQVAIDLWNNQQKKPKI